MALSVRFIAGPSASPLDKGMINVFGELKNFRERSEPKKMPKKTPQVLKHPVWDGVENQNTPPKGWGLQTIALVFFF